MNDGCAELRTLVFVTDFSPAEMNPTSTSDWTWPTTLTYLSIDKANYPSKLLTASASTLDSLELRWTSPDQLGTLLSAAPLLTKLYQLSIHEAFGPLAGTPQAEVPPDLIAFINSFPLLNLLQLDSIYPAQLADVLDALAHPPAALATSILTAEVDELDEPRTYDADQAAAFMASIVRCSASRGLKGVGKWRFEVLDDGAGWLENLTGAQMDNLFGEDGFEQAQAWKRFKDDVGKRGVRLFYGPVGAAV